MNNVGTLLNTLTNELDALIRDNPNNLSTERLQELRALNYVITRSSSSFIAATLSSYQILGQDNQHVDEWDGVVVEIGNHGVRITVVEAKDLASGERNENEAYNQLEKTRSLLRSRHKFTTRRYKIPDIGAALTFEVSISQ